MNDNSLLCHERLPPPPPPPPAAGGHDSHRRGSAGDDLNLDGIRSFEDQNLLRDERVLRNVLRLGPEDRIDYFQNVQTEIKPHMRKIVSDWMLEVCEEQGCQPAVFALAVTYLDRVLSRVALKKSQFQLLACVCMFLASKFKETCPLPAEKLVVYADFSITVEEITSWEILVLEILGWDLSTVTPYCVLEQILRRIDPAPELRFDLRAIREASETLVSLVSTEFHLLSSMSNDLIAVSCVLAAFNGMKGGKRAEQQFFIQDLTQTLAQITGIPEVDIARCQFQIASYVQKSMGISSPSVGGSNEAAATANSTPTSNNNNNNLDVGGGSSAKYAKLTTSASAPNMCSVAPELEVSSPGSTPATPPSVAQQNTTPTDLMDISVC